MLSRNSLQNISGIRLPNLPRKSTIKQRRAVYKCDYAHRSTSDQSWEECNENPKNSEQKAQRKAQYAQKKGDSSKTDSRLAHLEAQFAIEKALNKLRGEQKRKNKPTADSSKDFLAQIMKTEDLNDKKRL